MRADQGERKFKSVTGWQLERQHSWSDSERSEWRVWLPQPTTRWKAGTQLGLYWGGVEPR